MKRYPRLSAHSYGGRWEHYVKRHWWSPWRRVSKGEWEAML